jgi:hypothetical protein
LNGTNGSPIYSEFEHVGPLHGGEILMKSTVVGDLNLDGVVSVADFVQLAANFGNTDATWQEGDVNYDRQVTIADFIDLAANFGATYAGDVNPVGEGDAAKLAEFAAANVPEPEVGVIGAALMTGMMMRRRRGTALGLWG